MNGQQFFTGLKDRDHRDERDHDFRAAIGAPVNIQALPERVDLSRDMPPVMDQKMVSGCVGWAYVQAESQNRWAAQGRRGRRRAVLSPAFVYRECRALDERGDPVAGIPAEPGSLAHDWGTYVRNAWKVGNKLGAPPLADYRPAFTSAHFADPAKDWELPEGSIYRREPPRWIYNEADDRQALRYLRCSMLGDVLKSLADGFAVQIGFTVFRSFYGIGGPRFDVPMPQQGDAALGGHSVVAIGYDRTGPDPRITFRNQWGADAHEGRPDFTLPFTYHPWINDCWTGRSFE